MNLIYLCISDKANAIVIINVFLWLFSETEGSNEEEGRHFFLILLKQSKQEADEAKEEQNREAEGSIRKTETPGLMVHSLSATVLS